MEKFRWNGEPGAAGVHPARRASWLAWAVGKGSTGLASRPNQALGCGRSVVTTSVFPGRPRAQPSMRTTCRQALGNRSAGAATASGEQCDRCDGLQQLHRHCTGMKGRSALRSSCGFVEPPASHGVTVRNLVPCQLPVLCLAYSLAYWPAGSFRRKGSGSRTD